MANYTETIAAKCLERGRCISECAFLIEYGKTLKELADEALMHISDDPVLSYPCNVCGYCQKICPEI